MSTTNRAGLRAGVLGLIAGCVPALWLAGWAAAGPLRTSLKPEQPVPRADRPPAPPALAGGLQLGWSGQQLGTPAAELEDAQELRMHFPLESMSDRLDYEKGANRPTAKTPAETLKRLEAQEARFTSDMPPERTHLLMELHAYRVVRFIASPGFGFGRLGAPEFTGRGEGTNLTPDQLELPGAPAVPFAEARPPLDGETSPRPPSPNRLALLQADGLLDFLDPAGFGYVKDREHVAGFEPHRFRRMPAVRPEWAGGARMETWAVVRLELVSLLKHERPAVYVGDALPDMAAVGRMDTRPLAPFEEKALKSLREGDDLKVESSGDRIRMLGSLRAGKQCLECHGVNRGDLLGAFSWELQRQSAEDEAAVVH